MAAAKRIESFEDCVNWVLSGARPRANFRLGAEYERLVIDSEGRTVGYDGPAGIAALFGIMVERFGWTPVLEGDKAIALTRGEASISLEPAGQFELSGAPLLLVEDMAAERDEHLLELDEAACALGLRFVYCGMNPFDRPEDAPRMPKKRYDHMRAWMPTVGTLGLDMMHLTCTVQVNLDFSSGEEAMEMFRLGYLMTPAVIALFANSPWRYGAPTGMASTRAWIWTDVDDARCKPGDWVFDPSATVRDYVRWAFNVPMYFVQHVDAAGAKVYLPTEQPRMTFGAFFERGDRGRAATLADFELHMSTLFPDVRLKRYIELRGADCVPPPLLPALPALAKGLLYDVPSRKAALALLRDGDGIERRAELRQAACVDGLDGRVGELALRPLSIALLDLALAGIERLDSEFGVDPAARSSLHALEAIARGDVAPLWQQVDAKLRAQPSLRALIEPLSC